MVHEKINFKESMSCFVSQLHDVNSTDSGISPLEHSHRFTINSLRKLFLSAVREVTLVNMAGLSFHDMSCDCELLKNMSRLHLSLCL